MVDDDDVTTPTEVDPVDGPAEAPLRADEGYDTLNEPPPAEDVTSLRDAARTEMQTLAGHWQERLDTFDVRDAGTAAVQRSLWQDALRRFSRNRIAMLGL